MAISRLIAHTSALEMTQLSVIKTLDNCVISKADVWAIKVLKKNYPSDLIFLWNEA